MRSFEYIFAYLMVVGSIIYIMVMGSTRYHRDGIVGRLNEYLHKLPRLVVIAAVGAVCMNRRRGEHVADKVEHQLFEVRHPLMQWAYLLMISVAVVFYFWGVFPLYMKSLVSEIHYITAPGSVFLAGYCFVKACYSDPGTVTRENHTIQAYPYDEKLFCSNQNCVTCLTVKPARSKHCSLCNRCVLKFDHHCGWLNNDVGEKNYKWFLAFLISHVVLCSYGTYTCWHLLTYITVKAKLLTATFVTKNGDRFQADIWTVIQYLGQEYTTVCAELLFMGCVVVMMLAFLFYHLFLVSKNMTTNETFKASQLEDMNLACAEQQVALKAFLEKYPDAAIPELPPPPPSPADISRTGWIYNKGIAKNFSDVFFPPTTMPVKPPVGAKKKLKKR
eukprot:TRINITY_DN12235_c0_g1_i1.p1 TRINITY_DN12235_c0_g1~~TRINITY_DN12235_c0_g1_i1.p1  ORF type:complete len:410 (+),score=74.05 TRINITY_DN12235_c0_g1_i1:68-1231(+)